jgi:hypothetical protein
VTGLPRLRLLVLLFLLFLALSAYAFSPVYAANVTVTNNVIIQNAYGKLTAVGTMVEDSFAVYTNGTIFFNVATQYLVQLTYTFTAQSYGNGTFTVRFQGPAPAQVTTGGHQAKVISGSQDIVYSGADGGYGKTGVLIVSYRGVSYLLRDAAFVMAMFTPIVLFVGLAKWSQDPFDPQRPEKMKRLYYVALTMSIGTALLFIMSTLFNV